MSFKNNVSYFLIFKILNTYNIHHKFYMQRINNENRVKFVHS
jgi:hypothetical protein